MERAHGGRSGASRANEVGVVGAWLGWVSSGKIEGVVEDEDVVVGETAPSDQNELS